jgi:pimeloyl-ACP methyl ester carboxylesterase
MRLLLQQTSILLVMMPMMFALSAGAQSSSTDHSPHKSGFVTANGVRLHYLDWGGKGETMLFLHGIGDTPHSFDDFATKFTNEFRVLGLTRRGHGESDVPGSGYDTATRVEDIRQFLDALNISRAVLVGFSAAGGEVTMFAGKHPDRIIKVVYLDAIFDRDGLVAMRKRGAPPELDPPKTTLLDSKRSKALELMAEKEAYTDYKKIKSPVLAIVVVGVPTNMIERFRTLPKPRRKVIDEFLSERNVVKERETKRFREELPSARMVMLTNANHACFIDRDEDVLREMREFLVK